MFGAKPLGELQTADLERFMRAPEGPGLIVRNRMRAVLSSALERAVKWGWVSHNFVSQVPANPTKKRAGGVTDEAYAAARALAPEPLRVAMDLVMLTRQQQGKILALRWEQVHERVILFRDSKTAQKVEVEITPELRAVLEECRELSKGSKYVLTQEMYPGRPYTGEGIRAIWQRLMREKFARTGHDRFTFHDIQDLAERRHQERQARKSFMSSALVEFPQFEQSLTEEAAAMSSQYQLFFCLEQKIRALVVDRLSAKEGTDWWTSARVPEATRNAANNLRQKEIAYGITPRSSSMIDYINFGELSGLITTNWDVFEPAFRHSKEAVSRVIANLNLGRGPIAHCCSMSPHEVERLQIWVKDWFKQVK